MRRAGKEPFPVIYQDAKAESEAAKAGQLYEVVAKAQLKKQTKMFAQEVMIKVEVFWEGHKVWKKSPTCFDIYSITSKQVGFCFSNFVAFSECL